MTDRDTRDADIPAAPKRKLIDAGFAVVIAIAVLSGAGVWITQGAGRFFEILGQDLLFAAALLPKILGGILLATGLSLLIPRDRVLAAVGPESGLRGLAIAAAAGAILPGGPGLTFPLAAGLLASGADLGAGIAMVSGWVLLGANRTLIWELSFLPPDLVGLRYALTFFVPILLGLFVRAALRGRA